jgi:uncharacterized protein YjgD (DUF1641 family)|tara:strand:+ start:226 stop:411 length:186 start_codon:yes stop_codon:yes gene_type:complete
MEFKRIYSQGNLNCKAWSGRAENAQQMAQFVQDQIEREKSEKIINRIDEMMKQIIKANAKD